MTSETVRDKVQFVKTPHRYDPRDSADEYDLAPLPHPVAREKSPEPAKPAGPAKSSSARAPAGGGGAETAAPSRKPVRLLAGIVVALLISNVGTAALLWSRGGDEGRPAARLPAAAGPAPKAPAAAPVRAGATPPAPAPARIETSPSPVSVVPRKPTAASATFAVVAPRRLSDTTGAGDNNVNPRVLVSHAEPRSLLVKYRTGARESWTQLADWPTLELAIPGAAHVSFDADTAGQGGGLSVRARCDAELNRLVQSPRSQPASLRVAVLKKALESCQVRIEDASGRPLADFHFVLVSPG